MKSMDLHKLKPGDRVRTLMGPPSALRIFVTRANCKSGLAQSRSGWYLAAHPRATGAPRAIPYHSRTWIRTGCSSGRGSLRPFDPRLRIAAHEQALRDARGIGIE